VRAFVGTVFPACVVTLDDIMQLVPLAAVHGYTAALDDPPRADLPWMFSDTTGHRLRLLYGITEIGRAVSRGTSSGGQDLASAVVMGG
jgi:hypothetical protein